AAALRAADDLHGGAADAERGGERLDDGGVGGAVDGRRGDRDAQPVADRGPDGGARRARDHLHVDAQRALTLPPPAGFGPHGAPDATLKRCCARSPGSWASGRCSRIWRRGSAATISSITGSRGSFITTWWSACRSGVRCRGRCWSSPPIATAG